MSFIGVILAVVALFSWGFGDFFIQKSARSLGTWQALFLICLFGAIFTFPFVISELGYLNLWSVLILLLLSVVLTFAALFDFEALKQGKLAVIEPLMGLELPLTVALGAVLIGEKLTVIQALLILVVFLGIVMAATVHHTYLFYHRRLLEKGVIFAGLGAITMALSNFLTGVGSRKTSAFMSMWFVDVFLMLVCLVYLIYRRELKDCFVKLSRNTKVVLGQCFFDNIAWVAYAWSMVLIPIGVATAISESYIVLTVMLGIFVNHERLKNHQILGAVMAAIGVISLSLITATGY
ncbi:MAG: DMT family transporter [Patescibacteria group bacterium]|jgi:drug/metabolite transporter (DMT)-like permease